MKLFQYLMILPLLLLCIGIHAENKIIFLISPPRSLSTGFLRMMEARGDFEIFNEPTDVPFGALYAKRLYDEYARKDLPNTWEAVTTNILEARKHSHVFVKEMGHILHKFLPNDERFTEQTGVYFVFLLRKPQDSILSLYEKRGDFFSFQTFKQNAGYQQTYELYEFVKAHGKNPPFVIFSEELAENPASVISNFCKHMDIAFKPEALSWEDLGAEFTGHKEWKEPLITKELSNNKLNHYAA